MPIKGSNRRPWGLGHNIGSPPGTVRGTDEAQRAAIGTIAYGDGAMIGEARLTHEAVLAGGIERQIESARVVWVNVVGVHDGNTLQELGHRFAIHPLILEDIQNTTHRPKVHETEGALFATLKMVRLLSVDGAANHAAFDFEQISIFWRDSLVITFQERPGDVFDELRERIRKSRGRIAGQGAGYLFYALHDAIIDAAFPVVDHIQEEIDAAERLIMHGLREDSAIHRIQHLRDRVSQMRRAFQPLREVFRGARQGEMAADHPELVPFWQDAADHLVTVVETIESQREQVAALLPLQTSVLGTMMNQIMKTLTIIATIFIPLTFVAGVYGMNFDRMPELGWQYGYPAALGVMTLVALAMLWWFRRKRWI